MVDRPLILRKLAQLEAYLDQISEYSSLSADEYAADWKTQRIVERTLQMMIELCLDIAGHIIADRKLRVPVTYADAFKSMCESGLINADLLEIMEKMARFRNVIVHQYESIDTGIVVMILKKHLNDFLCFRDAILKIV